MANSFFCIVLQSNVLHLMPFASLALFSSWLYCRPLFWQWLQSVVIKFRVKKKKINCLLIVKRVVEWIVESVVESVFAQQFLLKSCLQAVKTSVYMQFFWHQVIIIKACIRLEKTLENWRKYQINNEINWRNYRVKWRKFSNVNEIPLNAFCLQGLCAHCVYNLVAFPSVDWVSTSFFLNHNNA